ASDPVGSAEPGSAQPHAAMRLFHRRRFDTPQLPTDGHVAAGPTEWHRLAISKNRQKRSSTHGTTYRSTSTSATPSLATNIAASSCKPATAAARNSPKLG